MLKQRVPETNTGITGENLVQDYDALQKKLRDRRLLETDEIIKSGITDGQVLEIGPGPGYLGLEWLKKCSSAKLYWLEISDDMIKLARSNAKIYNLENKINIFHSDATAKFPFPDNFFDGVFTAGSFHEWADPLKVINEIERVLKIGSRFFIGDFKRNINPFIAFIMKMNTKKKAIKEGMKSSIRASYTKNEVESLLRSSKFSNYKILESPFGLSIVGEK